MSVESTCRSPNDAGVKRELAAVRKDIKDGNKAVDALFRNKLPAAPRNATSDAAPGARSSNSSRGTETSAGLSASQGAERGAAGDRVGGGGFWQVWLAALWAWWVRLWTQVVGAPKGVAERKER